MEEKLPLIMFNSTRILAAHLSNNRLQVGRSTTLLLLVSRTLINQVLQNLVVAQDSGLGFNDLHFGNLVLDNCPVCSVSHSFHHKHAYVHTRPLCPSVCLSLSLSFLAPRTRSAVSRGFCRAFFLPPTWNNFHQSQCFAGV